METPFNFRYLRAQIPYHNREVGIVLCNLIFGKSKSDSQFQKRIFHFLLIACNNVTPHICALTVDDVLNL